MWYDTARDKEVVKILDGYENIDRRMCFHLRKIIIIIIYFYVAYIIRSLSSETQQNVTRELALVKEQCR